MPGVVSPNSKPTVPAPLDKKKRKYNKKVKVCTSENNKDEEEIKPETEEDKPSTKARKQNKKMKIGSGSSEIKNDEEEIKPEMETDEVSTKAKKRNSNPGVRVIHGKIYDSQNGTTCHQCRQKTYAEYVSCKNEAKTKPCSLKYCKTCLLNRYGEKSEEVALLDQWDCPKCRGACNCSICMKKRGHQPTGMISPMAKASGFSSVSELINAKGAQNVCNYKRVKETCASPRKLAAPTEGIVISSPKKPGKENLFDGKMDSNADPLLPVSSPVKEKPKEMTRKGVEVMQDDNGISENALNEKKKKKLKSKGEIIEGNVMNGEFSKVNLVQKLLNELGGNSDIHDLNATQHFEDNQHLEIKKDDLNSFELVIPLPTGTELVTIAGVDLPKEDAGNALQLLEFCSTFGKILDVKKGQAEAVLRDLINSRSTRRGKFTSVAQLHIQLLSVIQEESESSELDPTSVNDSWLEVLKSCITKAGLKHLDDIDTTTAGYDKLDPSTKLELLIFLCNEVLGTEKIRSWIDDQNVKLAEKKKEAREKICAAKDKEKTLKQKMQDVIAKAIVANHGVPITTQEHDALVFKIKNKAAEAHAEMLEHKRMAPEDKEKSDAMRTEPIFKDSKGHRYWRLKGCSDNPGILLQDIGTGDHMVGAVDKWFKFDDEEMNLIEGHIKRSRFKRYYRN